MKIMKIRVMLFLVLTGILCSAYSQTQSETFIITAEQIIKKNNMISISMDFNLKDININRTDMIILTPILGSNENNGETYTLPPIVITGTLRDKIINRKERLGNDLPFKTEPHAIIKRRNNTPQSVSYKVSVPYRTWMKNASLSVENALYGCANCSAQTSEKMIVKDILPGQELAAYELTFIVPEVEPVKARSERYTASFNYRVDCYELLRDYKNNTAELTQVDSVISNIQNNPDFQITEFTIAGYASPEGTFDHNITLAANRANSFADYLISNFGITRNKFTVHSFGEDWSGLREAVAASQLVDKHAVLDIIDKIADPDIRDIKLIKLSGGETYKSLLNDHYPSLRRTEYVVTYVVRAFDVEEGRQIIKTNPKLLSLNEMYLIAQSYPSHSKEFREVFDIAVRLYPDSEIAIINSAAADIEGLNYDVAIKRLEKIEDRAIAWNNMGVAHMLKGDSDKAKNYFTKSANSGDVNGKSNLKIISKMIDNE